ncbi:rRNA methyltransferase 3, mitochondrial [Alligator mississippiensis]|uniref:rRNA methyltransferase 3, mitochondrial n=1 Tax=Alligator mississippiensis TaxID=8496 RepID=A0A151NAF5_ALLMI|nr:rRNA methyltransferase 3, mitochondrial [Alligator mississippiensis]
MAALQGPALGLRFETARAGDRRLASLRMKELKELPEAALKGASLVKVKFKDIKLWSDLVAPQGLVGIFSKPDCTKMDYPAIQLRNSLPLSLICDNIRDPGNLGTILRSAAGAGCSKVLLTKGCVDPWEPKVLRAGMGAHFRVPVIANLEWESVPGNLPPDTCIHVAGNQDPSAQDEPEHASGKASSYGWISRPRNLKAQAGRGRLPLDSNSEEDKEAEARDQNPELAAQSYCESWTRGPVAVVIGGETQGLSLEALQLAESTGGRRLIIPVVPGMDSLNSAMAASIILFEGKRQLQLQQPESTRQTFPASG